MEQWFLIPTGIVIATFASLVGIGGGLLWAPYLILVLGIDPQEAVMFSFLIQFVGMGSATVSNIRSKFIYWKFALWLFPLIVVGIASGAFLSQKVVDGKNLEMGLGVVSIIVSLLFAFQNENYDMRMNSDSSITPPIWIKGLSVIFGVISGLFSIGTSDFLVPLMRGKLKIPMKYAVGTTLFLNCSLALIGGIIHILMRGSFPDDKLYILLFSWVGVLIGGQIGTKLAVKIGDYRLKELFIFVLLLIGIHLVYQTL